MKRIFLDTDVFLRFFTKDDLTQHQLAARLFHEAATGRVELWTGPPVFFELAWTLRRAYGKSRKETVNVLQSIAALPGLKLTDGKLVEQAISLAEKCGLEYADAYIAASAQPLDELATFNQKDFLKMPIQLHRFSRP